MSFLDRYVTTTPRGSSLNLLKIGVHAFVALFLVILLLAFNPFQSVPTGSRGVITQFGKITGVKPEGLVIVAPWEHLAIFNVRASQVDIDGASGSTSDTQPVTVNLTVRYAIDPAKVANVYESYSHDGDLSNYINTATQEVFKAITAKYTAPNLIAKRANVSADIVAALRDKVAIYGATIISVDMRNFSFQEAYMKAINDKVTQEQLRLVAENKLLTVTAEQRQQVAIAEATAESVRKKADGDAYAVLANARAQADALRIQGKALEENPRILELRRIEVERIKAEGWNGALPTSIYAGAPIPFLNVEKPTQ